jgi:hypothetical protein
MGRKRRGKQGQCERIVIVMMISILKFGPVPGKNAHYAAMDAWFTLEAHISMDEAGQGAGA